ncbi:hypothetical protein BDE02_03G064300 [Populus trichocarpa]|nr:hypothetical protein BDE02_03G064300 [Populus trichocarpa]
MTSQANGVGHLKVDENGLLNAKVHLRKEEEMMPKSAKRSIRACWSEVSHSQSNACRQTETNSLFIQLINYLEFREQQKYQVCSRFFFLFISYLLGFVVRVA